MSSTLQVFPKGGRRPPAGQGNSLFKKMGIELM